MIVGVKADINNTAETLSEILEIFKTGNQASFVCPAGTATSIINRLKIMLSRARKETKNRGLPLEHFTMSVVSVTNHHDITGRRRECVILAKVVTRRHELRNRILHNIERKIQDA